MNKSKLLSAALVVAIATTTASCHIYKKFEMPEEGIAGEVAAAQKEAVDSTALGNVKWEQVFTDPQLQALIQIALDSNVDLENARLNVDIAKAQLQGAKLSYLPSVALTPNGGTASYGGSKITKDSWSYTIPATASWEIDVFGKLLNNKRNAEAAVLQTEAYRQAVRSQIISGVANCYYTIAMLQRQLQILNETSAIWQESIKTMLSLGYTMEELWDYAFEKFGYDKNMGFIEQQANTTLSESQQMVNNALANAKGTYAEFTGTAKAAGTVAGNAYVAANAAAIQNGSAKTTAAATKNTTNIVAATAATTTADGKKVGAAYADAMAAGIESRQGRVIETIKKLLVLSAEDIKDAAEETIHKFIQAVGEIADKTDELTDYEPVIRPVVDMSDVEKKAQIINSTFNGGGRSYNVASRTQRAVTSSNNTIQSNSMKATPGGNVYQVTQNNYSPKALDRSTIYRQTKNLYSQIAKQAPQIVSSIYKKSNG